MLISPTSITESQSKITYHTVIKQLCSSFAKFASKEHRMLPLGQGCFCFVSHIFWARCEFFKGLCLLYWGSEHLEAIGDGTWVEVWVWEWEENNEFEGVRI